MQAQPWGGGPGFTTADLVATAKTYREDPLGVVLLWGVETWLQDPAWMRAAQESLRILRSS
jgi:hypothetical protein